MRLIFTIGLKNLGSNLFRTCCTIFGIALGVMTVATVLILDHNTRLSEAYEYSHIQKEKIVAQPTEIQIIPMGRTGSEPTNSAKPPENVLEEDYEMMRSAVRLASLLSFFIGAIIVYYTIGFTIQQRRKEFALLTSLGTSFRQIALIVLFEALFMGILGSASGLIGSVYLYKFLWRFGVTTTGRSHLVTGVIPTFEYASVFVVGVLTSIMGAAQPVFKLRNFNVSASLQPRFLSESRESRLGDTSNILSLILPIVSLTYVLLRPFLKQLIPSIFFYIAELVFIIGIFLLVVFFIPKGISSIIRVLGAFISKIFPLEGKLTTSRFSHFSHLISWPVSNLMLVFAFLLALHIATKSLKIEILSWGNSAAKSTIFVAQTRKDSTVIPIERLRALDSSYTYVRMCSGTSNPNRVLAIEKQELAKYDTRVPELKPVIDRFDGQSIILSEVMARELGVRENEFVRVESPIGSKLLKIIGITDRLGFFPSNRSYRERKSFALIEQENGFLMKPKEALVGTQLILWKTDNPTGHQFSYPECVRINQTLKRPLRIGNRAISDQVHEINKDFIIFDIILLLSTLLAAIGVTNTLLIQLQARKREIALLQVLGMTGGQIVKTILIEGLLIGIIGGLLAIILGIPVGWATIEALNVLSVFELSFHLPTKHVVAIFIGSILLTLISAFYPALLCYRIKSSESIQYE